MRSKWGVCFLGALAATGQAVRVAAGGETFRGVINKVAPELDAASRMITVEAQLDMTSVAPGRLLSGEIARISFVEPPPVP